MLSVVRFAAFVALSLTVDPLCAWCADKTPDQQAIDALETKAGQAEPRDQCFLYAKLVQQLTELSVRQYAAGNVAAADELLNHIQLAAKKIHHSLADNDKKLKDAEILLNETAFRLNGMLRASDFDDRALVEQTLAQVNQAQSETMLQIFHQ